MLTPACWFIPQIFKTLSITFNNHFRHVQINNDGAIEFYKKFGFEIVDTKEQYYKRIEPADAHVLQKALRRTAPNSNSSANNTTANSNSRSKARQFTFV